MKHTHTPKDAHQILKEQITASLQEYRRSDRALFISAFTAGLEIGFSVLLIAVLLTYFGANLTNGQLQLLIASGYPLGFIFVILGRSELFTEHTALAIMPWLRGEVSLGELLKLWGLVYAGNILGGLVFSLLLIIGAPALGIEPEATFGLVAEKISKHDWWSLLFGGILAGWLMGLLGWMVTSSQESMSRILLIIIITFIIGLAGLAHCVVGSVEMLTGLFSAKSIDLAAYIKFQSAATLGNIVGGTVFLSFLKYSHIRTYA